MASRQEQRDVEAFFGSLIVAGLIIIPFFLGWLAGKAWGENPRFVVEHSGMTVFYR